MNTAQMVKERLSILDVVGATVELKRSGTAYKGDCPFHAHHNHTPSFVVWPESGRWYCFGACNEGGDLISFVMKRDNLPFKEALTILAEQAGVSLEEKTEADHQRELNLAQLRRVLETAARYFHGRLMRTIDGARTFKWLEQRGLTGWAIDAFQLGLAGHELHTDFVNVGHSRQELFDAGLIGADDRGDCFDRFRNRLMLPVHDEYGRLCGFMGRALGEDQTPKFLNSPQTELFDKRRLLYGLHRAKPIDGTLVLVEGNLDVIMAHQAGFTNVVSAQGTALSEHQLRLLAGRATRIVLALDPDVAGLTATLRGLEVANRALPRHLQVSFDWQGLVQLEGRVKTDLRIASLPAGMDPDEVIRADKDAWQRLIERAEPMVSFLIKTAAANCQPDDLRGRAEAASQLLPLIEQVANPLERASYRQQLLRELKLDETALAGVRALVAQSQPAPHPVPLAPVRQPDAEDHLLADLAQHPEQLLTLDRHLRLAQFDPLTPEDFTRSETRALLGVIGQALKQTAVEPAQYVQAHATCLPSVSCVGDIDDQLFRLVLRLRRGALARWLREAAQFAPATAEHRRSIGENAQLLARLDRMLGDPNGHRRNEIKTG